MPSTLWKYTDRTCSCGAKFRASVESQTECTSCLIRPRKWSQDNSFSKESTVSTPKIKVRKEKICVHPGCGKSFVPVANRQVNCPEHSEKLRAKALGKQRPPITVPKIAAELSKDTCEQAQFNLLFTDLRHLANSIQQLDTIRIRGLNLQIGKFKIDITATN